jgi:ATP-dependent protease HslVU (ClpYQ) ATPase subunit
LRVKAQLLFWRIDAVLWSVHLITHRNFTEMSGEKLTLDAKRVRGRLKMPVENEDTSRFIL